MAEDSLTNLIINYLPQTFTDEEFRSMFLSIGPIRACKIVRDKGTNYSYGFGFVDYETPEDAQRAIQTLNGLQIQHKTIKVALARPGDEAIKGANVYIRNVPKTYKEPDLETHFSAFGTIIQSRVLVDLQTGESKGVGFVLYDKKSEALKAISEMNGKTVPGGITPLVVKFADDNTKRQQTTTPTQQPSLPLPRFPTPGGPMRTMPNKQPRFNPMSNPMGGYAATNTQTGSFTQQPQQQGSMGYILFVYNIGTDATDDTLFELFRPFGNISRVNVIYDYSTGLCKGFGFVTMSNLREAQNAIRYRNGDFYKGKQLSVSFKKM